MARGTLAGAGRSTSAKKNRAEYEGLLDVEESGIAELCTLVEELISEVEAQIKT